MALAKIYQEIRVNPTSLRNIERQVGSSIAKKLTDTIIEPIFDKVVNLCEDSLRSAVPFDTGELRNDFISIEYTDILHAKIGIANGLHYGRDDLPRKASIIANLLNIKPWKRSHYSQAISPFPSYSAGSYTKNWSEKALSNFKKERRTYLSRG